MIEKEIWKPIPVYNHKMTNGTWKYEISNLGRVRIPAYTSKRNIYYSEKILKHQRNQEGYNTVCLSNGYGKQKRLLVSRIVAAVFIKNPNHYDFVNHIDENKDNNRADNLEWCTRKYNNSYGTRNKRSAEKRAKPVRQYTLDGKFVAEYSSMRECERKTGYLNAGISACCRRKEHYVTQYGYIWRFKGDSEYEN